MQASYLVNGTRCELDANDRVMIRAAAASDEGREALIDEIQIAENEGHPEFADSLRVILKESDRLREHAKRHPVSHGAAHLPPQPMAAAGIGS